MSAKNIHTIIIHTPRVEQRPQNGDLVKFASGEIFISQGCFRMFEGGKQLLGIRKFKGIHYGTIASHSHDWDKAIPLTRAEVREI